MTTEPTPDNIVDINQARSGVIPRIFNGVTELWKTGKQHHSELMSVSTRIFNGVTEIWKMGRQHHLDLTTIIMNQRAIMARLDRIERQETRRPYIRPIEEYPTFDWSKLGAEVKKSDQFGAAVIEIGLDIFYRRSPDNRYPGAIWFSRSLGDGKYEKLIVFREIDDPMPLGHKTQRSLSN